MSKISLVAYFRFKDDIFIIFQDFDRFKDFFSRLKQGHPFSVKCESISSQQVTFLDTCVLQSRHSYRVYPIDKPSSLGTPWLSRHSAHNPSVHHWPVARLKSKLQLCTHTSDKLREARTFLARAKAEEVASVALVGIQNILKAIKDTRAAGRATTTTNCIIGNRTSERRGKTIWLVLPFHPAVFRAGLCGKITRFFNSHFASTSLHVFFNKPVTIRVSWKNGVKSVKQYLRSLA